MCPEPIMPLSEYFRNAHQCFDTQEQTQHCTDHATTKCIGDPSLAGETVFPANITEHCNGWCITLRCHLPHLWALTAGVVCAPLQWEKFSVGSYRPDIIRHVIHFCPTEQVLQTGDLRSLPLPLTLFVGVDLVRNAVMFPSILLIKVFDSREAKIDL